MKEYNEQNQLVKIKCNICTKEIKLEQEIIKEGCFSVDYSWGYFSNRDGSRHQFDLCEACYDKLVKEFTIPVTETENTEML